MLALVVNPGTREEQTFPLARGTATIGRTKDNEIFCVHKSLSRKHALVAYDGNRVHVTDLDSKNGIHFDGKRVRECSLVEGDSFRCGDVVFLVEGATAKRTSPRPAQAVVAAETLPSPFAGAIEARRAPHAAEGEVAVDEDDQAQKNRLFALIRATELAVGDAPVDAQLEELVGLAVQVLDVDRIALLTLDEGTLEMKPRAVKTFVGASATPYSRRVVEWIVDRGAPAIVADVSRDKALPGDAREDANVRAAMCAPIDPGGGTIGVFYVDSLSRAGCFHPDDLALLRALANVAALAIEGAALRHKGA